MLIEVKYSEDSMWGDTDTDFYDVEASYSNFEQMTSKAILEFWPKAEVEFTRGLEDSYVVDGDTSSDNAIRLSEIVSLVWAEFDWAV